MPKKKQRLCAEELSGLCAQIALIAQTGMRLGDGLEELAEESESRETIYARLAAALTETGSLHDALKAIPEAPGYLAEMAGIGEASGRLEEVMHSLSAYYEREARIRAAAVDVVTYPMIMSAMLALIVLTILLKVLPVFRRVLDGMGMGVTGAAGAMMRAGEAAGWTAFALTCAALAAAALCIALTHTGARNRVRAVTERLFPPVRSLRETISAARAAGALAMLFSGGVPLSAALRMAAAAMEDAGASEKLRAVCEATEKGEPFSEALARCGLFRGFHARMILMGGASGRDADVMARIAKDCEEQTESGVSRMISFLEPAMIAVLAIVVGAVLLSVLLPMAEILTGLA